MDKGGFPSNERISKHNYGVVVAGFCIVAGGSIALNSYGVFLKPLEQEFGWSRAVISGGLSLALVLNAILAVIAGRLTDRFGPRLVATVGGVALGLGSLLMSGINSVWQLYLSYGPFIGLGRACGVVPMMSSVARLFTRNRGLMTGIVNAGVGAGMLVPPVVGVFIGTYGWRTTLVMLGILLLVVGVGAAQLARTAPGPKSTSHGHVAGGHKTNPGEANHLSFQEVIHSSRLWIVSITFFVFGFFSEGAIVHIVPHVSDLGSPLAAAAGVMGFVGVSNVFGRVVMGAVADRIGSKRALTIVFFLATLALFWLQFARELWHFNLFGLVFGFAWGGSSTVSSPMAGELFSMRSHGTILGVLIGSATLGGAIGPLMTGYSFDTTGDYRLGFLISALLSSLALVLTLSLRMRRGDRARAESR